MTLRESSSRAVFKLRSTALTNSRTSPHFETSGQEDGLSPRASGIRGTRRHAVIIRDDPADVDTAFPSNRRPVYASSRPASSSGLLKLSLTELFRFPYLPTSRLSSSSLSSGMPPTQHKDVDFPLPLPCFKRRALILDFKRDPMSDADSDSEWYHNEFSKRIETPAQSPLLQPSRPDSIFIPADVYSPTTKRRSITSDILCPRKRNSRPRSIILPSYRPLPPIPQHPPPRTLVNLSRPPPRSTLPADCVIDLFVDGGDEGDADSDSSSSFSFTMYEIDLDQRHHPPYALPSGKQTQPILRSPGITKQRFSFDFGQEIEVDLDDTRFELDYELPIPFSIPTTPLDPEFDISKSAGEQRTDSTPAVATKEIRPIIPTKRTQLSAKSPDHLYTPIISPFSFPPSPSSVCGQTNGLPQEKALKSKWSTSTLGSVQEQTRNKNKQMIARSASAKLKLYFGGGSSTPPKSSKHSKNPSSSKSLSPPSSPSPSTPPRKTKTYTPSLSPSPLPLRWPNSRHKSKPSITQQPPPQRPTTPTRVQPSGNSSEVLIIGYGQRASPGLKRRGSNATMSSMAMSMSDDASTSSSSSDGLRRKPIPIEMFLRNMA